MNTGNSPKTIGIPRRTALYVLVGVIAVALVGVAAFLVQGRSRPPSESGSASKSGPSVPLQQPYKKALPFKKALTIQQYESIRLAHESPAFEPPEMPQLLHQAPSYSLPPVIRVPQVAVVPAMQVPSYNPATSIRMPQSSFSLPVMPYDPVDFPPMSYQGPGIPYANPHYLPPITNPSTFMNSPTLYNSPTNFSSPTFNNPPTLYNPPTNFNSPTFYNPPTLYNPPTNFNSPTFYNPPTLYNPPPVFNPPPIYNPPPSFNFP